MKETKICQICGGENEYLVVDTYPGKQPLHIPTKKCACRLAKEKEMDEQRRKTEQRELAKEIEFHGYLSKSYSIPSFANDDARDPNLSNRLRKYCEVWNEIKTKNIGLYLFGPPGTGKSFYASAIANYVKNKVGDDVLIGSSTQLIRKMTMDFERHRDSYEYKISNYPLFVIDDLGVEEANEKYLQILEDVIDMRLNSKLPMIVTSNFRPGELYNGRGHLAERIKSRLNQMCVPIKVIDEDRRESHGKELNALLVNLTGEKT